MLKLVPLDQRFDMGPSLSENHVSDRPNIWIKICVGQEEIVGEDTGGRCIPEITRRPIEMEFEVTRGAALVVSWIPFGQFIPIDNIFKPLMLRDQGCHVMSYVFLDAEDAVNSGFQRLKGLTERTFSAADLRLTPGYFTRTFSIRLRGPKPFDSPSPPFLCVPSLVPSGIISRRAVITSWTIF